MRIMNIKWTSFGKYYEAHKDTIKDYLNKNNVRHYN